MDVSYYGIEDDGVTDDMVAAVQCICPDMPISLIMDDLRKTLNPGTTSYFYSHYY